METPQDLDCLYHGLEVSQTADRLRHDDWCVVTGYGQSMTPILESGQSALVEAVSADTELNKDDIVFCNVDGYYYLHKIWAIEVPGFIHDWQQSWQMQRDNRQGRHLRHRPENNEMSHI